MRFRPKETIWVRAASRAREGGSGEGEGGSKDQGGRASEGATTGEARG